MNIKILNITIACAALASLLNAQSKPAPVPPPAANLNQLMRGLFFPHSNVVFLTQRVNPNDIKRAPEPSAATDPLNGVFGGWEAVENSALMLAESADLLLLKGRKCSNGKDVPLARPEWDKFVTELREASMVAYKASLTKDMENMIKATDVLNTSCQNCHNKFRPRNIASRCQ